MTNIMGSKRGWGMPAMVANPSSALSDASASRIAARWRQSAYRELFRHQLEPDIVNQIRRATNGNYVLGNQHFSSQIEATLGRRVSPGKAGRPRLESNSASGGDFSCQLLPMAVWISRQP
jgi:hypothetical protein